MKKYVDICKTLEILKMDSGLVKKPFRKKWNTFTPKVDDVAHVDEDNSDYRFNGVEWVKIEEADE